MHTTAGLEMQQQLCSAAVLGCSLQYRFRQLLLTTCLWLIGPSAVLAADTQIPPREFARMPPPGIVIPAETRTELEHGLADLDRDIAQLKLALQSKPALLERLPDVQLYDNAVRYALEDNIFYRPEDFATARKLLDKGKERARRLLEGHTPWDAATGLVVRGYRSKIDGSLQPYGLVVPEAFEPNTGQKRRLDFWFHGRNNKLSELSFIGERETRRGEFTPKDAFVLHPYGRYCNANKFAGEVDAFEALEDVEKHYPIDENRIAVRGFSMGGASTWHLAAHYAWLWAAAAPGAGFVDTEIFQKVWRWPIPPPWYQQRLWHLYDVTDYAANLFNCPVVAYSGEIDGQREAAELMARAMADEGLELVHIIGPNTGHQYEPKAKEEVARRVDALVAKGRDPLPKRLRFTTWTLRYPQMAWVKLEGLQQHWQRARVEAQILDSNTVRITTENVTALTLSMPAGLCPLGPHPDVILDSRPIAAPPPASNRSWIAHFSKGRDGWSRGQAEGNLTLKKRPGLQGPIDDAFMDSFIMVRPTGPPLNEQVGLWTAMAMADALAQWRWQFRGAARVKNDRDITAADIAANNLILWGDPHSNLLIGRIAKDLPIRWSANHVRLGANTFSALDHVPALIYPNPLCPTHYVVLNTGFTFADAAPASNALQIPELPDYALFDLTGRKVVAAGFFDENWQVKLQP
jgi:prolyl oligopeptidase family protein